MKTRKNIIILTALILLVSILASGCGAIQFVKAGEMKSESHSVDLGEATSARVTIDMDIGELKIDSGEGKLLEGTFDYNVSEWEPQVSYTVDGSQGSLVVNQPRRRATLAVQNGENHWDIRLNKDVPMEVEINTGAGVSEANFSGIDLSSLDINAGVGNGEFDLAGAWDHDVSVSLHGGVGEVTVFLPSEIGVRVVVNSGIGSVNTSDLSKDGDTYVNDAFGTSAHTLYLDVEAGIGDIELQVR